LDPEGVLARNEQELASASLDPEVVLAPKDPEGAKSLSVLPPEG
jgi:hypothetical protein